MTHRVPSPLSSLREHYRFGRRPSRLTLGVAAATAAVIAGVSVGVWIGAAPAAAPHADAAGELDAITAHSAGRADARIGHAESALARSARPSRAKVAAHRPLRPAVRVAPTARQSPSSRTSGQRPARAAQPPVRHQPARTAPYVFYDSVIPSAMPGNSMNATYATGPYAATPAQVAGRSVMWIDVYGTDYNASALDVEPSDATPDLAASWAWHRLSLHPTSFAHIYTSLSEWPSVQAACATLPAWMRARIRWWIADPTGVPHIVPGSDATQWYWGPTYDISTAAPNF